MRGGCDSTQSTGSMHKNGVIYLTLVPDRLRSSLMPSAPAAALLLAQVLLMPGCLVSSKTMGEP